MRKFRAQTSLLTTIIVVILLIVALSTATYAWFSANNVVNIADIQFTAASSSGEGDLLVNWTNSPTDLTYELNFATVSSRLKPMMPETAPFIGESYATFVDSFYTGVIDTVVRDNGSTEEFYKRNGSAVTPCYCSNPDDTLQNEFYAVNINSQFGMDVSVGYDITGPLKAKLRVAVFVEGKLIGIMTNIKEVYYGTIVKDAAVADTPSITNVSYDSGKLKFHLNAASSAKMAFVSWYDGVTMTDDNANGYSVLGNLTFSGAITE